VCVYDEAGEVMCDPFSPGVTQGGSRSDARECSALTRLEMSQRISSSWGLFSPRVSAS
jgi:hypothetical protein